MLPQAIKASEQPGLPSKAGILAQADRMVRSKAHSWLRELLPELEEKTAVSTVLPDCSASWLLILKCCDRGLLLAFDTIYRKKSMATSSLSTELLERRRGSLCLSMSVLEYVVSFLPLSCVQTSSAKHVSDVKLAIARADEFAVYWSR